MRRTVRAVAIALSALLGAALPGFAAGTAEILADIQSHPGFGSSDSGVGQLIPLGDRVLFLGSEPAFGEELWVSDGTPLGTRLVLDLGPGIERSYLVGLGAVGRIAVFERQTDFFEPFELWRSDGTAAGTFQLPSPPERCDFGPQEVAAAVSAGGRIFFSPGGCGLWSTNGSVAGTRSILLGDEPLGDIKELVAAGNRVFFTGGSKLCAADEGRAWCVELIGDAFRPELRHLTTVGPRVVFIAKEDDEEGGEELWISDGSDEGSRSLTRFFEPDPFGENPFIQTIGTTVYFTADDGTGIDLWQSEGGAPAQRVTDFIDEAPFGDPFFWELEIARVGNRLVFLAQEEGSSRVLWVSEGTPASTRPLAGCAGGCPALSGSTLVQTGNRVLFPGPGGLWMTDATGAGTRRLADVVFDQPVVLLDRVFFIGAGEGVGHALWKTDGTPAGTVRLANLGNSPFRGPRFTGFFPVATSGRIFFGATPDGQVSRQLWVSDGSPAGTRLLSGFRGAPGSEPGLFTPFAGGALFTAQEENHRILWRTDGTPAGTVPVRAVTRPAVITPASGNLAFVRTGYDNPFQIWRTDGTVAGSFRVDPSGSQTLENLVAFGRGAVFAVRNGERIALWESDGTLAGTRVLVDLPATVTYVRSFKVVGSRLWFLAYGENFSDQLWVSQGTAASTRPVTEEVSFDLLAVPTMVQIGETVYFTTEYGLWKTDGTAAGTVEILLTDAVNDRPTDLVPFQGALYFMAGLEQRLEHGLWRTDGTPGGTVLIHVGGVPARASTADPVHMVRLGDRLFFLSNDGEHGTELWSSDGTAAGTFLVRDIAPGKASAFSSSGFPDWTLTVAGDKIYFSATDGTSGFEIWESDGTAAGTRRVQDIAPAASSSNPNELAVAGNWLFFAADDGVHGKEPWVLPLADGGCTASATALCLGGRFRVEAEWRDFAGNRGRGRAAALTADTGTFWFFDAANVEVILKVLDGRSLNGHHWVFYGALSNVEYTLTITDTETGAVRRYFNPSGWLGSLADTEAFGPRGATLAGVVTTGPASEMGEALVASKAIAATGSCTASATRLCLQDGRFAVEARWKAQGQNGAGQAVPLAGSDTGYFWFFDANNVEVVLKVLDGTPLNGKFWVFYGALSDVEYTLTVTDTVTGTVKTYTNLPGRLASVADTAAF